MESNYLKSEYTMKDLCNALIVDSIAKRRRIIILDRALLVSPPCLEASRITVSSSVATFAQKAPSVESEAADLPVDWPVVQNLVSNTSGGAAACYALYFSSAETPHCLADFNTLALAYSSLGVDSGDENRREQNQTDNGENRTHCEDSVTHKLKYEIN